jgi:hypothetical protein
MPHTEQQKIRIRLKSYDSSLLNLSCEKIIDTASRTESLTMGPNTPIETQRAVIDEKLRLAMPDILALQNRVSQFSSSPSGGAASVVVNVQGSVTTERDLVNAITQGIYNNQASGIPISYSTAYR